MSNKLLDMIKDLLPIVPCQEATRLASKAMDQKLSLKEIFLLKLHLMVCNACTRFRKHIYDLRKIMRNYQLPSEQKLPLKIRNQIKDAINNTKK